MRANIRLCVGLLILVAGCACAGQPFHQLAPHSVFLSMVLQAAPGFSTTPPSPIDLGPSAVGMTTPHAAALPIQMHNPGTATLSISSFSFSSFEANFTAESLAVLGPPLTVPAGSFQPANVLFTPQGPGKR